MASDEEMTATTQREWLLQTLSNILLWRACNPTAYTHNSTGPVVHPFASRHEGPVFNPQGGTYVKPELSC
jgi:hypothetical protein